MGTTTFTGPVQAGNVIDSDGSGTLASAGGSTGTQNVGYCLMAQTSKVTQATNIGVAGVYKTNIVIPAQSQIVSIQLAATTAWSGSATVAVGSTAGTTAATAFTAASASPAVGITTYLPTTATQNNNWVNVSNATFQTTGAQDVQIKTTSSATGTGTGYLTVVYIQSINVA
jgi:hypothetical protein